MKKAPPSAPDTRDKSIAQTGRTVDMVSRHRRQLRGVLTVLAVMLLLLTTLGVWLTSAGVIDRDLEWTVGATLVAVTVVGAAMGALAWATRQRVPGSGPLWLARTAALACLVAVGAAFLLASRGVPLPLMIILGVAAFPAWVSVLVLREQHRQRRRLR